MTIFVVFGSTGEYSDRREWPVAAFFHEEAAQQRIRDCESWLLEHGCARRADGDGIEPPGYGSQEHLRPNPHDPSMVYIDYTGIRYYLMEVPAIGDLPDREVLDAWVQTSAERAIIVRGNVLQSSGGGS